MSANAFLSAIEDRRSLYQLANKSPISDERIHEIVAFAIRHTPSPFNVQSARVVILLRTQHEKLWDFALKVVKDEMPPTVHPVLESKVSALRVGYGTALWFEDETSLEILKQKNPAIQHVISEWSDHSSGMHQFVVWTALEQEGLGCNLQHYNFSTTFNQDIQEAWGISKTWKLKSQLVFGEPVGGPDKIKTFNQIDGKRLLVFS
ncbi:hypothetical protein OIDMADRAFT_45281 [Oidiodendron maius Zn]|uniref:Nitroreductase domain-containing protein n=1 Tax=Oidiodendron maius (strain Zn) TaxID=913774 RepID=A0A0C3GH31_OIDMZ|nr:hypothetical protein OIDMADRAFT_45281 [Oidiodendron maius Zn]